jgi:hypothetical protein
VQRPVIRSSPLIPFNRAPRIFRFVNRGNAARNNAIAVVLVAVLGVAGLVLMSDFRNFATSAADGGPPKLLPALILSALRSF